MTGLDFFSVIYRQGVNLPIRIFTEGNHTNIYREEGLCFCNLGLESEDEIHPGKFDLLEGMDVSIISEMDDRARELAKALIHSRPKHLTVCDGENLLSWAPHRGWK
jgi:hypothetical protein